MKTYIIYQVMKADLLERVRRPSFLAMCIFAMFLAFFSVPDVEVPLVSICMEPGIFRQGSNPSWIPIAIALCGGVLFPMAGLSFVKNNISMDRESGLLYSLQSMNMKKGNYVIGKFLSNLSVLTVMWMFVILGAALMLPFRFPDQPLAFYDFISAFIGMYPGIVFASAFAVLLESVPFISSKAGNAVGLTALFELFLVNYSSSGYDNPLLGAFDYGNYRWVIDSINDAVVPIIGRGVWETGILVPGGMFAGNKGGQELVFHGLLWSWKYLVDKIILIAISMAIILSAAILLETTEKRKKASSRNPREKGRKSHYCASQFLMERRLLLKSLPKSCLIVNAGLWIYSLFAPLQYVQGYLWIIMLVCSVTLFSQMGCREHENSLTECFVTIKFSLVRQAVYSYLWAVVILFMLSMPAIIRCFGEQKFLCSCSYIAFSFFVPALACFLGEYSKSRRAFETVYLLICFLLLNMPSFLFQGYVVAVMVIGTIVFLFVALVKRLHL